ncbi:MAG TPA: type II secretion system protein GspK [Verrucomicrobiae bacterium]|nr:type II secretion system protein GspK [Verrucomicrobiae bacterium]
MTLRTAHIVGRRGSALFMVLWVIALISFLTLGLIELMKIDIDMEIVRSKDFRARQLAESGIAIATHPSIERYDPLLFHEFDEGESYDVRIESEDARLNINRIMQSGDTDILRRLFTHWDLTQSEIDDVLAAMEDWFDSDDLPRLNGAEFEEYIEAGRHRGPGNAPFRTLDELREVLGLDVLFDKKPDWIDFFSIYSSGRVNLNDAPIDLIQVICGVTLTRAESFVRLRNGPDREEHTEDDVMFENQQDAAAALGLSADEFQSFGNQVTLQSSTIRITSVGRVDEHERTITVILRRTAQNPTAEMIAWEEE